MFRIKSFMIIVLFSTICSGQTLNLEKSMPDNRKKDTNLATAVFAGGCFWCIEAIFESLKGVESVEPGYAGGTFPNPTYEEVCAGITGHAEVIRITYNPKIITYNDLLEVFWHVHNPTTLNRQGNDIGEQYRSAIFYANDYQKNLAKKSLEESEKTKLWKGKKYVTKLEPLVAFYLAENYHNDYFKNNPDNLYCNRVVAPKVMKFRKKFKDKLKSGR